MSWRFGWTSGVTCEKFRGAASVALRKMAHSPPGIAWSALRIRSRSYVCALGILSGGAFARADGGRSEAAVLPAAPESRSYCTGDYADDSSALSPVAQEHEYQHAPYTFCVRTTATYACPFYGPEGDLQSSRQKAIAHGTAFAYREEGKDTLLLTNQHVSDWPSVTDEQHRVDGVARGCKRVSSSLSIVDNESDAFEADDLALSRVVSDPQLDVAVLRAHAALPVMPWRIGRSAKLRARNVVHVRGFPLGIFKATNVGKVISAYDHDTYGNWDHDDFVVDALLSAGNSGSPVLAISCKTGEFELVGIFHAGYSRGSAMNVVVGVDQVHELMTNFKRKPRAISVNLADEAFDPHTIDVEVRRQDIGAFLFPFAARIGGTWIGADGALIFGVLAPDFPAETYPVFAAESSAGTELGAPFARVWFGKASGLASYQPSDLDAETQVQLARIGAALRRDSYLTARYRSARREATSREAAEGVARLQKALERAASSQKDLMRALSELADRLGPGAGKSGLSLAEIVDTPRLKAGPPSQGGAVASGTPATPAGAGSENTWKKQGPAGASGKAPSSRGAVDKP